MGAAGGRSRPGCAVRRVLGAADSRALERLCSRRDLAGIVDVFGEDEIHTPGDGHC